MNLIGKKLIFINDTEDYIQNIDIIKAYTGNESIRERRMYAQDIIEVRAEGLVVAVENQPLNVRNEGNAIIRRI